MTSEDRVDAEAFSDPSGVETRAPMVSDRALVVLVVSLAITLLIAVTVALMFWHTPAAQPIELPMVGRA